MQRVLTIIRGNTGGFIVTCLCAAFASFLILSTDLLNIYVANSEFGTSGTVQFILFTLAFIFISIATYVGGIVTANTVAIVVSTRLRELALLRLLGSGGKRIRNQLIKQGAITGIVGTSIGILIGVTLANILRILAVTMGYLPKLEYPVVSATLWYPFSIVLLTMVWATWSGTKSVLKITPMQALAASTQTAKPKTKRIIWVAVRSLLLGIPGCFLIYLALAFAKSSAASLLIAFVGGVLSLSGLISAAGLYMPKLISSIGRLTALGVGPRLAAHNAVRHRERTTKTAVGLFVGITLTTTFIAAAYNFKHSITIMNAQARQKVIEAGGNLQQFEQGVKTMTTMMNAIFTIFIILIGFTLIISAIGVVNNLLLNVVQRKQEIGLLRIIGLTSKQVRHMVTAESAQLAFVVLCIGSALGCFYGWLGVHTMLGTQVAVPFYLPWPVLVLVLIGGAALVFIASIRPVKSALSEAPISAVHSN